MTNPPERTDITVIIPVRDGASHLPGLLDSLAGQRGAPPFEVIVIDNGSTDGTAEIARRHPVGARVIHEARAGSYRARNRGIESSRAPVLAFTDADCVPEPDWLAAGAAAAAVNDLTAGRVYAFAREGAGVVERYDRVVYLDQELFVRFGFGATANLFVRRDVVDAVGAFDESLQSSGDWEFCTRATEAGFTIAYAPTARVAHHPRTTLRALWKLNARLGTGWRALARRGRRPPIWREGALVPPFAEAAAAVAADGPPVPAWRLRGVHGVVIAGRIYGRLTGRS